MSSTPRSKPNVAKEPASPRSTAAKPAADKKPKAKKPKGSAPTAPVELGMPMHKITDLDEQGAKKDLEELQKKYGALVVTFNNQQAELAAAQRSLEKLEDENAMLKSQAAAGGALSSDEMTKQLQDQLEKQASVRGPQSAELGRSLISRVAGLAIRASPVDCRCRPLAGCSVPCARLANAATAHDVRVRAHAVCRRYVRSRVPTWCCRRRSTSCRWSTCRRRRWIRCVCGAAPLHSALLPHADRALSYLPRARGGKGASMLWSNARDSPAVAAAAARSSSTLWRRRSRSWISPTGIRRTWSRRSSLHGGCSARVAPSSPNMWRSTITTTRRIAKTRRSPTQSRKPPLGGLVSSTTRADTNQCARDKDDAARALGECAARCDRVSHR